MMLESIAIDFRCRGCGNIRRLDADLGKRVVDQLPQGWVMENLGACCGRCAGISEEPTPKEKADAKREEVRKLRMPTAEVSTLGTPITEALSPLVSDTCTRCNNAIGEMESWRPDPLASGFAKAHRICLDKAMWSGK